MSSMIKAPGSDTPGTPELFAKYQAYLKAYKSVTAIHPGMWKPFSFSAWLRATDKNPVCDRCGGLASMCGGTALVSYVPPFHIEATRSRDAQCLSLCANCEDYITDAMDNLWPDKRTQ